MPPITLGIQISKPQLGRLPSQDTRHSGRNLSCNKLKSTPRGFVIEQNTIASEHVIRFPIIAGQVKTGHFANTIARARMKAGTLVLRGFVRLSKHLARPRKIETTARRKAPQIRKEIMRA